MDRQPAVARNIWRRLEPLHAVTYFSPEPLAALAAAGYRGFWMGYFAGRAAPLGAVGPDVVGALFYNFAPSRVARALPDAWAIAPPSTALDARRSGSVAALRRALGDDADGPAVEEAASLASRAARSASPDGRALFAANAGLDWPTAPLDVLWHAATLLREHRGDGHVALLTAARLSGRESNVFQAAAGNVTREMLARARDYDDAEWSGVSDRLVERGLLAPDGSLTREGRSLKQDIEDRTDALALGAYAVLDDGEVDRLLAALTPLAKAVVATGDIPATTPMGPTLN